MINTTQYRTTDVSGNLLLDDGPRWPLLPRGDFRMHCIECPRHFDASTEQQAERLLIDHLTVAHGWREVEN
jgi:hypothetical protein